MKQSQRKNGYTLIEMIAVLVMVLPIILLVSLMLRRSMVQYTRTINQAFEMRSIDQWTQRMRDEIHEANEASVSADGSSLTLTCSNQENTRYFQEGLTTWRQQTIKGRSLAIERSPWSSPLQFAKTESSRISTIEIETNGRATIKSRLGIHAGLTEAPK